MTHIFYFHGLDSKPDQSKVQIIGELFQSKYPFREITVESPQINWRELSAKEESKTFFANWVNRIKEIKATGDQVFLIGSSMGGYFSYHLSGATDSKAFLFNPAIIKQSVAVPLDYKRFEIYNSQKVILLGLDDEIVNPIDVISKIKENANRNEVIQCFSGIGHRTDANEFQRLLASGLA